MRLLDQTYPVGAENLACDEALLDWSEENGGDGALRFWAPENYFVVVGYGNHVDVEVNRAACAADSIPVLRRCSGGGTVLQGPGCLNYSLILKIEEGGPLQNITAANRFIMERNRAAIQSVIPGSESIVEVRGHTDLTLVTRHASLVASKKFSGNAQRRKRHYLLFHGTFLLQFDLPLISRYLRMPSKQPDYRQDRSHQDFLTNIPASAEAIRQALCEAWDARDSLEVIPQDSIALLMRDKYVTDMWNLKF